MTLKDIYTTPASALSETLRELRRIENKAARHAGFVNWVNNTFSKYRQDLYTLASAIHSFTLNNFTYQDDQHDEDITAPYYMLKMRRGDCDDMALFVKTIFKILNIPANYILLGQDPRGYTHIAVIAGGYVVDPTNGAFNNIPEKYFNRGIVHE